MVPEIVSVPTRGVERWLSQRLSARLGASRASADGVCANFAFQFPGRLIGGAVAAASGIDAEDDPWTANRSVWPLLGVIDDCLAQTWLAPLAAHLGAGPGGDPETEAEWRSHRFAAIRHIADLYDRYAVHRPQMLCAWAGAGSLDADETGDGDGGGRRLPPDVAWQAELWRQLRARIAVPSPAERLAGACDRIKSGTAALELPSRFSLFGLTRLPVSYVQALRALSVGRDVHLFLLHPSPALWARMAEATGGGRPRIVRRRDDYTASIPRNPLLASWGQDAREMQLLLTPGDGDPVIADDHRPMEANAASLLQRIQADIRADRPPPGAPLPGQVDARPQLDPQDRSLQVHSCHGLARQVEVMRDAILHLLQEDPTLEPRDVIVMCPDIETFAPLIYATFGAGDIEDPGPGPAAGPAAGDSPTQVPDLRVRLADRSLRQTNPILGVLAELLDLASARLTAPQVLDLAGREPLRRRFDLDDDDLARLDQWVASTGIRWGLDGAHRAPFKLQRLEANTWRSGLDRVLLGVAMAEEGQRLLGGVLPLDDVGSGDIDLAGRFAELIERLHATIRAFNEPQPLAAWAETITAAADALTATTDADSWQRMQLQGLVDEAVDEATIGPTGEINPAPLTLPEIRALLADRLRGRPTRANFRTGHLTICTLVPMRSVPHRVVGLLGLDDGVFPRQSSRDGDDIIGNDPQVGDRDSRIEDRQLLLDALLAATDHLIVTYAGRAERTNAERPPAVPVGELLDVVDRTVSIADSTPTAPPALAPLTPTGPPAPADLTPTAPPSPAPSTPTGPPALARSQVIVCHPLQPFDGRNFTRSALVDGQVWSFDPITLEGARALARERPDRPPFLPAPLPAAPTDLIELDALVRFVQHPVNAFLRQRLGINLGDYSDDVLEGVPIELDYLEMWGVGQRLLDARLAGSDQDACIAAEVARGLLPPGALADPVLDRVGPVVERLVQVAASITGGTSDVGSVEVNVALPDGRLVVGTVAGVRGNLLGSVTYSRVSAKHRLAAWVRFLALTAAHPERSFEAVTIGRGRSSRGVAVARFGVFEGSPEARRQLALHQLAVLVDLYDRGMCEPLPLYCKSSAAYAEARGRRPNPEAVARQEWESTWDHGNEDAELSHQLVLGGVRSFHQVLDELPRDDEQQQGWAAGETTRFGGYARRLWDDLLAVEKLDEQ